MKTKTFLFLCLFLGIGLTQLSAQNGKNGTGSFMDKFVWETYGIDLPVDCNGTEIDRLTGPATLHAVFHFKDGEWIFNNITYDGELTSEKTGVVYSVQDHFVSKPSQTDPTGYSNFGHAKLMGNDGSYYILNYTYVVLTDSFIFTKITCPWDDK